MSTVSNQSNSAQAGSYLLAQANLPIGRTGDPKHVWTATGLIGIPNPKDPGKFLGYVQHYYDKNNSAIEAIGTSSGIRKLPTHVAGTGRDNVKKWIPQALQHGAIKGPLLNADGSARRFAEDIGVPVPPTPLPPGLQPSKPKGTNTINPTGNASIDLLQGVANVAAPDAWVVSSSKIRRGADSHLNPFVLIPTNGDLTKSTVFIALKVKGESGTRGQPGFIARYPVLTQSVDGRTEIGEGISKVIAPGVTLFANLRNSALPKEVGQTTSVNAGFFVQAESLGSGAALKKLGKLGKIIAAVGPSAGAAYRGELQRISADELQLNISGQKFKFKVPADGSANGESLNYGSSIIARARNFQAYVNGANVFDVARNNKAPNGTWLNHGDPISSIAGKIQQLNDNLQSNGRFGTKIYPEAPRVETVNTNDQAKLVMDFAASHRSLLDDKGKVILDSLMSDLKSTGSLFSNDKANPHLDRAIKEASPSGTQDPMMTRFVHAVFSGKLKDPAQMQRPNVLEMIDNAAGYFLPITPGEIINIGKDFVLGEPAL